MLPLGEKLNILSSQVEVVAPIFMVAVAAAVFFSRLQGLPWHQTITR
jgi:hypothetical protein